MTSDVFKQEFVSKYMSSGDDKFYKFLLVYALNKLIAIEKGEYKGIEPSLELMDYHDRFVILYRREGEEIYLSLARCLRKAAHKIYRVMLKKNMTIRNSKFLNLV